MFDGLLLRLVRLVFARLSSCAVAAGFACAAALAAMVVVPNAAAASWTMQSVSVPGMESTGFFGVACVSPDACTAVGQHTYEEDPDPLVENWDGTSWQRQEAPTPTGASGGRLESIACPSASICVATGWELNEQFDREPVAGLWDGANWTLEAAPDLSKDEWGELSSVSCSSSTACIAVGYSTVNGEAKPIAEGWDGATWSMLPEVSSEPGALLTGVSCPSSTTCMVVGSTRTEGSTGVRRETLAYVWNGTAWSETSPLNPATWSNDFSGVSCSAEGACTAVGEDVSNGAFPLAERWDGEDWAVQTVPFPLESSGTRLYSVSCATASSCDAVGTYGATENPYQLGPVNDTWNGSEWTPQTILAPSEYEVVPAGVACLPTSFCSAVGYTTDTADTPKFLKPLASPGVPAAVPVPSPAVFTGEARELLPRTGVELSGRIRDAGQTASWFFEYGETSSYGQSTPVRTFPASAEAGHVAARITSGLFRNTIYHYRLVTLVGGEAIYGDDQIFEGPLEGETPPSVTSPPPAGIGTPPAAATQVPAKSSAGPARKPRVSCRVPNLSSLTLAQADRRAKRAHCALGKVRKGKSTSGKTVVVSQSPGPGAVRRNGARIQIRLGPPRLRSKGRH